MKGLIWLLVGVPLFASEEATPVDGSTSRQPSSSARVSRLPPPEVRRGERVSVTVLSGAVQLKFDAETESSGHVGETVIVKNPENGRRFVARVEDVGKVLVKK